MDPKKMLITPEKTVEADEKKAAAEAEEAAEEEALQEHYDHVDRFLSEAEKLKAAGKERGVDDSLVADNAGFLRTGVKMVAGKQVSEEENSDFREQAPSLKEVLGASIRKDMSQKTPQARVAIANQLRKMMGDGPLAARVLKELNIVDSEEPSEPDKENA